MIFNELYEAHEKADTPVVAEHDFDGFKYRIGRWGYGWALTELDAALLVARLLAMLPPRTASEAVALSELVRREGE